MASKKARLQSGFTLGGEQAEADPVLEQAFFESSDYKVLASHDDPRCFIVGRTGSGKSAALQHLEEVDTEHVIRISPEDLSLPYITDLGVFRYLDSLEVNLDLLWIALWKHVLLVEILRKRYSINSAAAKQSFLRNLRERLGRDTGKRAALDYLEQFQDRFWCEADERVREITDTFSRKVDAEAEASGALLGSGFRLGGSTGVELTSEQRAEQASRFQRIVNETQLARLNKMLSVLDEDVLDSGQHYMYVLIDDLDRDWVDERLANDLIRCLFRTVLDLKRVQNLKVLVALRTNIFQQLDFGGRSGGQEEKFRSLVLQMRWTHHDLERMLDERVRVVGPQFGIDVTKTGALLPNPKKSRGNPLDYIFRRTLMRPRDAIAFMNECLAAGIGKTQISWDLITSAERAYSAKRLLALRDEWKTTYPGIDSVFECFRRVPAVIEKERFAKILDDAMLLLADPRFQGVQWMTRLSKNMWLPDTDQTWFDLYGPLTSFLYAIGLVGCRARSATSYYLDDPYYMDSEKNVEEVKDFCIHPTYHEALDVKKPTLRGTSV